MTKASKTGLAAANGRGKEEPQGGGCFHPPKKKGYKTKEEEKKGGRAEGRRGSRVRQGSAA